MNDVALSCRGLTAAYNGHKALHDVHLDIVQGEWLGLIGPNGAGKSTLLRSIAGLVSHEGIVKLADGRCPTPTDVALLPQNPVLPVGMTVAEYALLGRTAHLGWLSRESREDRRIVSAVLQRLELTKLTGRPIVTLSGGETQRVLLARALAQQASTLLLDEPTSALDIGHRTVVLELLEELRHTERLTIVSAMHDLTVAAYFVDRLALIHHGRILAYGAPEEVIDAQLLSEVYETPLTVRYIENHILVLPKTHIIENSKAASTQPRHPQTQYDTPVEYQA